eukprot:scaffold66137_cov65-Attheya_sp.AAC.4
MVRINHGMVVLCLCVLVLGSIAIRLSSTGTSIEDPTDQGKNSDLASVTFSEMHRKLSHNQNKKAKGSKGSKGSKQGGSFFSSFSAPASNGNLNLATCLDLVKEIDNTIAEKDTTIAALKKTIAELALSNTPPQALECPAPDSFNRVCIQNYDQCASDNECSDSKVCCLVAGCGKECMNPTPPPPNPPKCPAPDSFNIVCIQNYDQCASDSECSDSKMCCLVAGCGKECMDPL